MHRRAHYVVQVRTRPLLVLYQRPHAAVVQLVSIRLQGPRHVAHAVLGRILGLQQPAARHAALEHIQDQVQRHV